MASSIRTTPTPSASTTAILETEAAAAPTTACRNSSNNNNTYFAPLRTWDVFARTLHLLQRRPTTFLGISFVLVGLHAGFQWLMTNYLLEENSSNADDADAGSSATSQAYGDVFTLDSFANAFVRFANWVLYYLAVCLLDGATVRAVAELYAGEASHNVTAALAIGTAAQHLVPLIGACLLVTFAVVVPALLIAIVILLLALTSGKSDAVVQGWILAVLCTFALALIAAVWTYHMYPAIIVERRGIVASIQRSIQLSEGHRGEIFAILLMWNAFKFVLTVLVTLVALSISVTNPYVEDALLFLVLVFTSSCGSILKAVVYFHVRIVKEDYKPENLAAELSDVTAEADTPYERMGQKEDTAVIAGNNNNNNADPTPTATNEGEIV